MRIHLILRFFLADGMTRVEIMKDVQEVEKDIQRRLPIGSQVSVLKLKTDFLRNGHSEAAISRALMILGRRGMLQFRNQGKTIYRQAV
jgi:DNA replication licensing factor MCM5